MAADVPDRHRRGGSVRVRTTALATVVSGTALVLGSVLLLLSLGSSLHRAGDDLARGRVQDLTALAQRGSLPRVLTSVDGEGVAQVFTRGGTVLAASPNIVGRPRITGRAPSATPTVRVVRGAPDDAETETYRVWTSAASSPRGEVTILAGSSLESVDEASRTLRRGLAIGVPLLVLLVAGGTWLLVGGTLRPVEDIRAEVASITEEELDRRVPVPRSGDEVSRLAQTMNEMLGRLQDGARRQRDFVADASHELQSPITALRTQLEVALADEAADWPATARQLLVDTDEMEHLVHDLLFLARTHHARPDRSRLLDLDDVVLEEAARLRGTTDLVVVTRDVSAAPVHGDPDELRRLVRNLLENARRHAATTIRVRLRSDDHVTCLDVIDDGPGVPSDARDRVFDRFYSTDTSRSRGRGSGLGLAIARQVALRHAGTLRVADDGFPGARFELRLTRSSARARCPASPARAPRRGRGRP